MIGVAATGVATTGVAKDIGVDEMVALDTTCTDFKASALLVMFVAVTVAVGDMKAVFVSIAVSLFLDCAALTNKMEKLGDVVLIALPIKVAPNTKSASAAQKIMNRRVWGENINHYVTASTI